MHPDPRPPPEPSDHIPPNKVYILDCKSCHTFLTNRAMKAVLLLRPNVPLYSSDALPVNCSVYTSNSSAFRSTPHFPPRTCECLTQTLSCHGCGSAVGYMIVIPCIRCTSSIITTNRATNGHRFVFHFSEIIPMERHYIPDEPGVLPYEAVSVTLHIAANMHHFSYPSVSMSYSDPNPLQWAQEYPSRSRPSSPMISDSPRTPPPELVDSSLGSSAQVFNAFSILRGPNYIVSNPPSLYPSASVSHQFAPHPYLRSHPPSTQYVHHMINRPTSASSPPSPVSYPSPSLGIPQEQKGPLLPRTLQSGDVLFWHHLARSGEIPGIEDDVRARGGSASIIPVKTSASRDFYR